MGLLVGSLGINTWYLGPLAMIDLTSRSDNCLSITGASISSSLVGVLTLMKAKEPSITMVTSAVVLAVRTKNGA